MRKLRNTGERIEIEERLPALKDRLAEIPGLVAAFVYGSYGPGDQTPLSDVDLALLFEPGSEPSFDEHLEIVGVVTDTLGEDDASVTLLHGSCCVGIHWPLPTSRPPSSAVTRTS